MKRGYEINEVFTSMQGEGIDAGKMALFVRFAGCNRACFFCDTDHSCKGVLNKKDLLRIITRSVFPNTGVRHVVFTGGEPLCQDILQLVKGIYEESERRCVAVTIETNGTIGLSKEFSDLRFRDQLPIFISLSPKVRRREIKLKNCNSLKILYPYSVTGVEAAEFIDFPAWWRGLQPVDGRGVEIEKVFDEILRLNNLRFILPGNEWRVSLQTHKLIEVR